MTSSPILNAPSRLKRLRLGMSLLCTYSGPKPSTRTIRILRRAAARPFFATANEAIEDIRKCRRVIMVLPVFHIRVRLLSRVFFHFKHGPPDCDPRPVLVLEHPQVPAVRPISCA